jgi:hypothetical protein
MTLGTELPDVIKRTARTARFPTTTPELTLRVSSGAIDTMSFLFARHQKKVSLHAPDCKSELLNVAFQVPEHQRVVAG